MYPAFVVRIKCFVLLTGSNNMMNGPYETLMPEKARIMTEEEIEYECGFLNFIAAAVCSVASIGCSAAASLTGCKELEYASYGLDLASAGLSLGVTACVGATAKGVTKVVTNRVITSTINTGNKIGTLNGRIAASDYMIANKVLNYALDMPLNGVNLAYNYYS